MLQLFQCTQGLYTGRLLEELFIKPVLCVKSFLPIGSYELQTVLKEEQQKVKKAKWDDQGHLTKKRWQDLNLGL